MSRLRALSLAQLVLAVLLLYVSFAEVSREFHLLLAAIAIIIFLLLWMSTKSRGREE
jgi:lysylphosphatidylglycerol synthetase-like protein (DUF2156 family)